MPRIAHFSWSLFLIMAGWGSSPLPAQPQVPAAVEKPASNQPGLFELAKLYQEFDLPLPPKKAFFAITDEGTPTVFAPADKKDILYQLRFAIGDPHSKSQYRVWSGFRVHREETLALVFSKLPTPEKVMPFLRLNRLRGEYEPGNESYSELVFAIQCQLLGHFELAKFFYRRCVRFDSRRMDQNLVLIAWNYWASEFGNPKREMPLVAKKLRQLIDKHRLLEMITQGNPKAKEELEKDGQDHHDLVTRIELTLNTKPAKPGSIEAMIDKLLMDATAGNGNGISPEEEEDDDEVEMRQEGEGQKRISNEKKPDPKAELRNLGFVAIPVLIDHVDDERIIRHPPISLEIRQSTFVNARSYRTVGAIARQILLTFFDLNSEESTKEDYLKSWNEIKSLKESEFVSKALESKSSHSWLFLDFVLTKHHDKFISYYPSLLKKYTDSINAQSFISMVSNSKIPIKTKIDMLASSVRDGTMLQKYSALGALLDLDNVVFSKHFQETLEKPAKKGLSEKEERYRRDIIKLGFYSKDSQIRGLSERCAMALPLKLKLEIALDISANVFDETTGSKARAFIFPFLEDKSLYKLAEGEHWPLFRLNHNIGQIEIRNLMALNLLKIMDIHIPVDDETTEETWAQIRMLTKEEIDRRLENKSKQ